MSEPFAQVPAWLLEATYRAGDGLKAGIVDKRRSREPGFDPEEELALSDRAVRLYAVLDHHAGKSRTAWPSRTTLARRWLGCSPASVDRALKELTLVGGIKVVRRIDAAGDPTTNLYEVLGRGPRPASGGSPDHGGTSDHGATPTRARGEGGPDCEATGSPDHKERGSPDHDEQNQNQEEPEPGEPEPAEPPSSSSSRDLRASADERAEDDEDDQEQDHRIVGACRLLARRDLEERKRDTARGPIVSPPSWLDKATRRRLAYHEDDGRRILTRRPELTAEELADELERRPSAVDPDCPDCSGKNIIPSPEGFVRCSRCNPGASRSNVVELRSIAGDDPAPAGEYFAAIKASLRGGTR